VGLFYNAPEPTRGCKKGNRTGTWKKLEDGKGKEWQEREKYETK